MLFDLGCGDGRFLIAAAERVPGLQCVGIEVDPVFAKRAKESLSSLPVEISSRVEIREEDVMKAMSDDSSNADDLAAQNEKLSLRNNATAVFLYLLPKGLSAIKSTLEEIAQQRRKDGKDFCVVSYMFQFPQWKATKIDRTTKGDCAVYLYSLNDIEDIS